MRWSFRLSRKTGPFRVNLSRSGIGVSAGIPGARISLGPKGTHVSLGFGGFQYRRKLAPRRPPRPTRSPLIPASAHPQPTHVDTNDGLIPTATASSLAIVAPDDVITTLQKRLRRPNLFKVYLLVTGALTLLLASASPVIGLAVGAFFLGLGIPVYRWDRSWRWSQLIYDPENAEIGQRLAMASQAGQALASASAIWHVHHSIATSDWKRNAGAGTLIRRTPTCTVPGTIPGIDLNIEPWAVPVGPQKLLFLPDRLLVWDGRTLAGVPYEHLFSEARALRFVEDERLPRDARVVDTTWQYVNKRGGPDRRFANNRQFPVVEYGELLLSTGSGLRVFLQTSTPAAAFHATRCLSELSERARHPVVAPLQLAAAMSSSPPVQPSSTPNQPASTAAIVLPLMVVMRSLAGADRRIDANEIEFAYHVHRQLTGTAGNPSTFAQWFRSLSANDAVVAQAVRELATANPDMRRWIVEQLERLTAADGKQTKKEAERLSEIRITLG